MAMMGYSAFPKAPALLKPHPQIVLCHIQDTRFLGGQGSYPSAEVQTVYSTAPADYATYVWTLMGMSQSSKTRWTRCKRGNMRSSLPLAVSSTSETVWRLLSLLCLRLSAHSAVRSELKTSIVIYFFGRLRTIPFSIPPTQFTGHFRCLLSTVSHSCVLFLKSIS